jgi:hypothetical protein
MERLKERVEGGEEGGEDGSIGGGAEYVRRAHHTVETRIFVLFNIEYLKHPAPTHRALFFPSRFYIDRKTVYKERGLPPCFHSRSSLSL